MNVVNQKCNATAKRNQRSKAMNRETIIKVLKDNTDILGLLYEHRIPLIPDDIFDLYFTDVVSSFEPKIVRGKIINHLNKIFLNQEHTNRNNASQMCYSFFQVLNILRQAKH